MRVFARLKKNKNQYYNLNIAAAAQGFFELGAEVIGYNLVSDIYDIVQREDVVLDGIDQCNYVFDKFTAHPTLCDYPKILHPFMGRKIWSSTIDYLNSHPEEWNCFVKPVSHKEFTGRVVKTPADLIGCGNHSKNNEILCTDIVDIKREWRGFVRYDKLIDIRPYKGDWHYNYDANVVDACLAAFRFWDERPTACSLDFAVIEKDGKEQTIFLEQNDAYALGSYGLYHSDYAKLISARWAEIMGVEDEYKMLKTWSNS